MGAYWPAYCSGLWCAVDRRFFAKQAREGVSPFEVGDPVALYALQEKSLVLRSEVRIVLAKPGMSIAKASTAQLDLLASTQAYLRTTIGARLTVWASP